MGETWEEDGEQIETDDLYKRREKYNCEVPEEVLVLTAGVDVQDDRFEAEVVGWGVEKESWGIKYQVIYGDLKLKPVWDELDRFLSQTFTTADGRHLKIICACVDSGGHFTTQVYRFCKERTARRVFAIKARKSRTSTDRPRQTTSKPRFSLWALIQARRFYISVWRCRKRGRITATSRGRKTGDIRRNTSRA